MRIDKGVAERLCKLSDEELWGEIRKMAASYGLSLPDVVPSPTDLSKVRSALEVGEINTREAMQIVNDYKRGKR